MTWYSPKEFSSSAPENYERYFVPAIGAPVAADLMQHAALHPGERVLDAGCGTGIVARLAADQVAPDGLVSGLDVNPGMLAVAKSKAAASVPITWHEAPAEKMPFEDSAFDAVLCQMCLQFVEDRQAALAEMDRVLAPGGRLVMNVPGPLTPFFKALAGGMARHIQPEAAGFVARVFSLHDTTEIGTLLNGAGLADIDLDEETLTLSLPPARDFLWQYVHSTPLSAVVAQASNEARQDLEHDVVEAWRPYAANGGLEVEQRIVTAIGRKPV